MEEGGSLRAVVSVDKDGLGGGLVLVPIDDEDVTVGAEDLWEVGDEGDGLGLQSLLTQYVGGCSGGPTGLVLDGLLLSLGCGGAIGFVPDLPNNHEENADHFNQV